MRDEIAESLSLEARAAADLLRDLATDDAELAHDMVEGETGLLEAIGAALAEIDQCEIIAAGCKAKADEIGKRRARAEGRAERVRAMIERALLVAEIPTVTLPTATISVKRLPPRLIVDDESVIPAEFWIAQPPKLDKTALNAAAKDREIPGTATTNGSVSLQIRRS